MMLDLYEKLNEKDYLVYLDVKQSSSFVYAVGSVKNIFWFTVEVL